MELCCEEEEEEAADHQTACFMSQAIAIAKLSGPVSGFEVSSLNFFSATAAAAAKPGVK